MRIGDYLRLAAYMLMFFYTKRERYIAVNCFWLGIIKETNSGVYLHPKVELTSTG
jgi:hypothetical protein